MISQQSLAEVVAVREKRERLSRSKPFRAYHAARNNILARQAELQAKFETTEEYRRYADQANRLAGELANLAQPQALTDLQATLGEESKLVDALKKQYRADPTVEPGPLRLQVEATPSVSWESFWKLVRERPGVAAAVLEDRVVGMLIRQANLKDPQATFVTLKITSFDVVPAGKESS